jgi:4-hydroxy-tetrahydrodipicolinate synthase
VLVRRGLIAHPTLRTPGPRLTAETRAEVDWLLHRLAARDPALTLVG